MIVRVPATTVAPTCLLALLATPAATAATAQPALEEITVTAQWREERLQDVPIAISAISGDELVQRGIRNVLNLTSLAPNVQVSNTPGNNTGMQIAIRGGATINPALFWDPTVGIYIDGVYVAKNLGSVFDVVDLERVEVLRGPQGTLYGRNTLAGAVNFVTRQPSGEFQGRASLDLGEFSQRKAKFSLDLPKFGVASVSFGGFWEERDGHPETTPGSSVPDLNNRDRWAGTVAVRLDFTDDLAASYRFDYTDLDQRPQHSYLVRADLPFLEPYVSRERLDTVSVDADTFERMQSAGHSLTLTWDVSDDVQLRSITGYRDLDWGDLLDLDGSDLLVAHTSRLSDFDNFSQELQVVGSADRLNYVVGAYYYEDDGYTNNPQTFFFGTFNFDSRYGFGTDALAAYAQLDYQLTDAWTLTGGLRYTHEKKKIERALGVNFAPDTPFVPLIPAGTSADETFSATTPMLAVAYRLSDDVNLYARYAEGFKSGGFNGEYGDVGFTPEVIENNIAETRTPFDPEKQKTFEIGAKSTLAGGALTLNAAVFYNKIDDLQLSIFTATGAASSVIRNAGKATTSGFELEAAWRPIEALRLQLSYGYLDAEYDEFIDRGVDQADNRAFVHAPKHTFNLVADGRLAQTRFGALNLMADYAYSDDMYLYPYQLASSGPDYDPTAAVAENTRVDAIGVLNARLALSEIPLGSSMSGEVALWSRNLLDADEIANGIDFGPGFGNLTTAYFLEPRTWGVEFSVRW